MSEMTPASDPDTTAPARRRVEPRAVAASALALGALAFPDHTRMSPGRRHLLRLARSAYVGWYAWDTVRRTPMFEVPAPVFGAVSGAAAALVTAPVDEAVDGWVAGRLRSWGMRRPRLALALVGAGVGAVLALENQSRPASGDQYELFEPADFFEPVDVPDNARALVEAMLDAPASSGGDTPVLAGLAETAATLRVQLDQARASVLRDQPFSTDVHFEVPAEAARVVPHGQGWPVRAHFEAGGLPLMIELWIGGGLLSHLSILKRSEDLAEDDERWSVDILDVVEDWPTPDQVRLVMETADDPRPVG